MDTPLSRLKQFIESQSLTVSGFEKLVGFSNGSLASQIKNNKSIGLDKLENILTHFPLLSTEWLMTGSGTMLKPDSSQKLSEPNAVSLPMPQPGDEHELELIKKQDSTEFRHLGDDRYMIICPLVEQYAYAGYTSGWTDPVYVDELPRHAVIVRNLSMGVYRAFVVRGDSMDDGLKGSISDGDIVTGRKLVQKYWHTKIHIHQYKNFVLVTNEGIQIKEIIDHKVEEGIIVCRSRNPDKETYPDFEISLADVREIYYVKAKTERLE